MSYTFERICHTLRYGEVVYEKEGKWYFKDTDKEVEFKYYLENNEVTLKIISDGVTLEEKGYVYEYLRLLDDFYLYYPELTENLIIEHLEEYQDDFIAKVLNNITKITSLNNIAGNHGRNDDHRFFDITYELAGEENRNYLVIQKLSDYGYIEIVLIDPVNNTVYNEDIEDSTHIYGAFFLQYPEFKDIYKMFVL